MKGIYRVVVVAVMVIILLMNPVLLAWGNPPPGRWEKVSETTLGQKMIVHTKKGGKNTYIFRSLDNQFLNCVHPTIGDMQIELDTIQEIVIPKAGKYAKGGILWGAAGGAGVGVGLLVPWTDLSDLGKLMVPITFAGIGAGVGFLTGAAVGAPGETIYISKEAALVK